MMKEYLPWKMTFNGPSLEGHNPPPKKKTKILDQKVSQKVRILILLLAIIQDEKKPNILTSKLYKVTKSAISPQRKIGSF